jgi:hypothetical protein
MIKGTEGNYRTNDHKYDFRASLSDEIEICKVSSQQLTTPVLGEPVTTDQLGRAIVLSEECDKNERERDG